MSASSALPSSRPTPDAGGSWRDLLDLPTHDEFAAAAVKSRCWARSETAASTGPGLGGPDRRAAVGPQARQVAPDVRRVDDLVRDALAGERVGGVADAGGVVPPQEPAAQEHLLAGERGQPLHRLKAAHARRTRTASMCVIRHSRVGPGRRREQVGRTVRGPPG